MRGDVYRPKPVHGAKGHEQAGRRYAVIVVADQFAPLSTWLAVPTSASAGAAIYRPEITVQGAITRALPEQVNALDPQARPGELVGHLGHADRAAIDNALRLTDEPQIGVALLTEVLHSYRAHHPPSPLRDRDR
jgi:mRNA interferase MazF